MREEKSNASKARTRVDSAREEYLKLKEEFEEFQKVTQSIIDSEYGVLAAMC